ncbi:MAG: DUF5682 family protein [Polyangiaceae bacterium]
MALVVVGVRHHSPACARVVAATIRRLEPRFVLIEGPSDMNERLSEFALEHELPIALFSYRQEQGVTARSSWAPFCDYSPEWLALRTAREVGAEALFIDLPAWHPAFEGKENRYSDRNARENARHAELLARLGFENNDALWDHLFEQPLGEDELAARLGRYFAELRADDPPDERDGPREAFMSQYVAWAMQQSVGRDVVVVCGGYHKPALERDWQRASSERPRADGDAMDVRVGSYLVPFSFPRLDSFAGYASGMPSPAFYQRVWERGAAHAGEDMLFSAIRHLRKKMQPVSPADAIAASTLAQGLCALRGHAAQSRCDVLDGLAGALVKDALDAPLPWSRRGTLAQRTEPLLVELVRAFAGERVGKLAPGTPQPPLVHDALAQLERVGIEFTRDPKRIKLDLAVTHCLEQSFTLHRLRVLGVPQIACTRGPSYARNQGQLSEEWRLCRVLETEPALIEAAQYGATLESAALGRLEERALRADGVVALAEALVEAARSGLRQLTASTLNRLSTRIDSEPSFSDLGQALATLLALRRGDLVLGAERRSELDALLAACFERGLWLFEGISGPNAPLDSEQLRAVGSLREAVRQELGLTLDVALARAVCERRAHDPNAPPSLRGAALGFVWSLDDDEASNESAQTRVVTLLRSLARPESLGDFASGLFALAREKVLHSRALLTALDDSVQSFGRHDFLVALPALRQAFAHFPPRERLSIAEAILELGGGSAAAAAQLLSQPVDDALWARTLELEARATERAARFGLADTHDQEPLP